jgi:phosphohistidine phosphatase
MKTLLIVRHGKSSWDEPDLSDRDRPLKDRGITDARKMSAMLLEQKFVPQLVISSPAQRARQTAELFCETFGIPADEIVIDEKLYFQGEKTVINLVKEIDNRFGTVMITGHNPDFTDLANHFMSQSLYNLPTAGVVKLQFDCKSWSEISRSNLKNDICLFPKSF